jgi:hypothetical protein
MPYDPTLPAPNSPLESQVIRDQLQALFNLINNIVTVTAAQVDSTNTLPPGSARMPASAWWATRCTSASTFRKAMTAMQGSNGSDGAQGPPEMTAAPANRGRWERPVRRASPLPPPWWTA